MNSTNITGAAAQPAPARLNSVVIAALLGAAATLRIFGAANDLWLDEIWSIGLADHIRFPSEIVTSVHHDNNHYLNTLFLYLVGPHGNWPGYRMASLVFGVLTVCVAGLIGRRKCKTTAIVAMLFTSVSYVLVHYSSEARGYSGAVFFSYLSYYMMDRYLDEGKTFLAISFSVSACLGLLSHLIYLNCLLAAGVWLAWVCIREKRSLLATVKSSMLCFVLPLILAILLYVMDIRIMMAGGGDPGSILTSYLESLALAAFWTPGGALLIVPIVFALSSAAFGIEALLKGRSRSWPFFAGAIVVFPLALAVARGASFIYARYFMVGTAFLLLLMAFGVASLLKSKGWRRWVGIAACTVFLIGNAIGLTLLFKNGRGQYSAALSYIAANTTEPVASIAGDNDFRVGFVLDFHAPEAMGKKEWKYYKKGTMPAKGAEWFIVTGKLAGDLEHPTPIIKSGHGLTYNLDRVYPTSPLSGMTWILYRNDAFKEK